MNRIVDSPIRIENGEVTVEAAFLAPKLGLNVETLQEEMRRGAVVGVVEEGRDEDAGRTRVTFRHGDRSWQAVIAADGSISETRVSVRRRVPPLFDLVRRATWG